MIKQRDLNGAVVYDLDNFNNEADLARICNTLADTYSINVFDKLEGPGTTIWKIEIADHPFSLVNNTWGCFLKPESNDAIEFTEIQLETLKMLFL